MTVYVDNGAAAPGPERSCMLFANIRAELVDFTRRLGCGRATTGLARVLGLVGIDAREADRAIVFGAIPVHWRDTPRLLTRARAEAETP